MSAIERAERDLKYIRSCQRYTLARCRKSGVVADWTWGASSRQPPLPFHSTIHRGQGYCRVCGQETGGRWTWDPKCFVTYTLWTNPATYANAIAFRQKGLCAITREPIGPPAAEWLTEFEIDHEIPIYRVRRDLSGEPWFELLRYWGLANLRGITRAAHAAKNAAEARERAGHRATVIEQGQML